MLHLVAGVQSAEPPIEFQIGVGEAADVGSAKPSANVGADRYTPSVDRLFETAAKAFGSELVGVILTGMGDDGRLGAQAIRASGGRVIAESEETAVIFGMPQQAIRAGAVDWVLPLDEIARALQRGLHAAATDEEQGADRSVSRKERA